MKQINKGIYYVAVVIMVVMSVIVMACNEPMFGNNNDGSEHYSGPDPVLVQILKNKIGPSEEVLEKGHYNKQVFYNYGIKKTASLYGITISNGSVASGGGMSNRSSLLKLTAITFWENHATKHGDGIYNSLSGKSILLVNSIPKN